MELTDSQKGQIITCIALTMGIPASDISDSANLSTDVGMDALDIIEVTMFIERVFDITFVGNEYEAIETVGEIFEEVENLLDQK